MKGAVQSAVAAVRLGVIVRWWAKSGESAARLGRRCLATVLCKPGSSVQGAMQVNVGVVKLLLTAWPEG